MKKHEVKLNITKVIRRLVQIASFILLPELFISIFNAIRDVYTALITGTFSFSALSYQLILLAGVIPITLLMGRFFCGFFCAFGSMGDFIWFISGIIRKKAAHISEGADRVLKSLKYVLLLLIVILIWTFGLVSIDSTASPWTIFGMYASLSGWPSASYLLTTGAALLLIIMMGSFFIERFFCRYLCPLGAVFSLLSLLRVFRINKPRSSCGACTLCTHECTMGISLNKSDQVSSGECINCLECVEICPRHNIKANPTPAVATTIAAASIAGLYCLGSLSDVSASAAATSSVSAVRTIADSSAGSYSDGVYTGSAAGYRGTTAVQVTVTSGEIEDIEILSTNDDIRYFTRAESSVITKILLSQSPDVSTVSGATFSSNAIINAVKNALSGSDYTSAISVDTSDSDTSSIAVMDKGAESASTSDSGTVSALDSSGSYTDGTYTGSGTGFRGETTVTVSVSGGVITDITVVSYKDDTKYFNRAEDSVIASIISKQSIDVSTVSGATFSSNGIIEAVADALSVDFTNSNSTMTSHMHKK